LSVTQNSLLDQILSGTNRSLQVLAAQGLVPLPPEDLIPIQVALTTSPDEEIAGKASEALEQLEPHLAIDYLRELAGPNELGYFGSNSQSAAFLTAIIRRPDVPRELLVEMARRIPPEVQEPLVLRQDAILEAPEILWALESNPQLSSYAKRRIWEYREHLLPKEKVPPKSAEEIEAEAEALSDAEVQEAIAEVKLRPADGKVDEISGLSAGQVRLLPVPIRVKLARNADRQMRALLIRDSNTQVAVTVLYNSSVNDQEVELIASSRNVVDEVLEFIAKRREWIRRYSIAKALVKNPRTHLATAIQLVPRMVLRDLRDLARDRNVPEGVRSTAKRLYLAKR
jgi:hypothetical protein